MALAPNALFRSDMTMLEPPQNRLSPGQIWPMENPVGTEQVRPQYLTAPDADVVPGVMWGDRMYSPRVAGGLNSAMDIGMGFAGSAGPGKGLLSLERTTLPKEWAQPNNHKFTINRAGEEVGSVHTEYNPQTGELYIQDIEGHRGPHSFGLGAIRELREALLEHYPEAKTLSGYRSTGAGAGREAWQRIQQYQGREE
jgi:hypothetical protein